MEPAGAVAGPGRFSIFGSRGAMGFRSCQSCEAPFDVPETGLKNCQPTWTGSNDPHFVRLKRMDMKDARMASSRPRARRYNMY